MIHGILGESISSDDTWNSWRKYLNREDGNDDSSQMSDATNDSLSLKKYLK